MCSYEDNRGFTLVEILVAIAILPIILAGVYAGYLSMETTRNVQGQVTEMQRNARSAMHMILQDLRQGGYGMTEMPDIPIWQYYKESDGSTESTIPVYAVKSPMNGIFLNGQTQLTNTDSVELYFNTYASQNTAPLKVDGTKTNQIEASLTFMNDVGGLNVGDIIVAYDYTTTPPQALVYEVTSVDPPPGTVKIGHNAGQSGTVNAPGGFIPFTQNWTGNTNILNLNLSSGSWIGYFVDSNNNLVRSVKKRVGTDWVTEQKKIASGIEDLQIEYTFKDGPIRNLPIVQSWTSGGAVPTEDSTYGPTKIRSISVGIIARTTKSDPKYTDTTVYKLKDGVAHSGGGYRRMVLTSDVALRNLMAKDNNQAP
ncbi:MAG: PilW family protein [Geobacter sp.]|nr:PilW family protein [Geobacter sp.]